MRLLLRKTSRRPAFLELVSTQRLPRVRFAAACVGVEAAGSAAAALLSPLDDTTAFAQDTFAAEDAS